MTNGETLHSQQQQQQQLPPPPPSQSTTRTSSRAYNVFCEYKSNLSPLKQKQNKQKLHIQNQYKILLDREGNPKRTLPICSSGVNTNNSTLASITGGLETHNKHSATAVLEVTRACWTNSPRTSSMSDHLHSHFTEKESRMIQVDFVRVLGMIPSGELKMQDSLIPHRKTHHHHIKPRKQHPSIPCPLQWDPERLLTSIGRSSEYHCEHCPYISHYIDQLVEHSYRLHGQKASTLLEKRLLEHIFEPSSCQPSSPSSHITSGIREDRKSKSQNRNELSSSSSSSNHRDGNSFISSRKLRPEFLGTHSWSGCTLMRTHPRSGKIAY